MKDKSNAGLFCRHVRNGSNGGTVASVSRLRGCLQFSNWRRFSRASLIAPVPAPAAPAAGYAHGFELSSAYHVENGGGNLPPSLGIARAPTEPGHSVAFAGRPEMVARVEAAGFRAIELTSAYAGVDKYLEGSPMRRAACYLTSLVAGDGFEHCPFPIGTRVPVRAEFWLDRYSFGGTSDHVHADVSGHSIRTG